MSDVLCGHCKIREAAPSRRNCVECGAWRRAVNRKHRKKRRAEGRCYQCPAQAEPGKAHCLRCLARLGATYKPVAEPKRLTRCSECELAGHNAQSCLRRQVLGR